MSQLRTASIKHKDSLVPNLTLKANGTTEPSTGGALVGYQQGTWNLSVIGATDIYGPDGAVPVWSRIGQTVFLCGRFGFADTTNNEYISIQGLPYLSQQVNGTGNGLFVGSCMAQNANDSIGITAFVANTGPGQPSEVYFYQTKTTTTFTRYKYSDFKSTQLIFSVSYLTDDTTWTPQNGATVS